MFKYWLGLFFSLSTWPLVTSDITPTSIIWFQILEIPLACFILNSMLTLFRLYSVQLSSELVDADYRNTQTHNSSWHSTWAEAAVQNPSETNFWLSSECIIMGQDSTWHYMSGTWSVILNNNTYENLWKGVAHHQGWMSHQKQGALGCHETPWWLWGLHYTYMRFLFRHYWWWWQPQQHRYLQYESAGMRHDRYRHIYTQVSD